MSTTYDPKLLKAAENMDWTQVAQNGGPLCFHLEDRVNGRFCGRAQAWDGHGTDHAFVPLADLLKQVLGLS